MTAALYWNPDPVFFYLPFFNHPILYYGLFFALGFCLGYFLLIHSLKSHFTSFENPKEKAVKFVDRLVIFVLLGTTLGARFGHLFFYEGIYSLNDFLQGFLFWKPGLASHGGAIGVLAALWLYCKKERVSYLFLLDVLAVPTCIVGGCIRIGNFFNQEILGIETELPWAVAFGNPAQGAAFVPRHPVQLYESLFCFLFAAILFVFRKKKEKELLKGKIAALFFVVLFSFRFFIEFLKLKQSNFLGEESFLTMGQLLSLPFIIVGIFLLKRKK